MASCEADFMGLQPAIRKCELPVIGLLCTGIDPSSSVKRIHVFHIGGEDCGVNRKIWIYDFIREATFICLSRFSFNHPALSRKSLHLTHALEKDTSRGMYTPYTLTAGMGR